MSSDQHLSAMRPAEDETLMSFLRRVQIASNLTDAEMQTVIIGTLIPDARRAERRHFDWDILSRFVNASPDELFAMSERSMVCRRVDSEALGRTKVKAPWGKGPGYGAHCPTCIAESEHWRKSWLRPDAAVCDKHQAFLIRHCEQCGTDLESLVWKAPAPYCPACGAHFALEAAINVPADILEAVQPFRARCTRVLEASPVDRSSADYLRVAATWRMAELFTSAEFPEMNALFEALAGLRGIELPERGAVGAESVRRALAIVVADDVADLDPGIPEIYDFASTHFQSRRRLPETLAAHLGVFAEKMGIDLPPSATDYRAQLVIPFMSASWSNLPSIAA